MSRLTLKVFSGAWWLNKRVDDGVKIVKKIINCGIRVWRRPLVHL